jgi:hypothetical protein
MTSKNHNTNYGHFKIRAPNDSGFSNVRYSQIALCSVPKRPFSKIPWPWPSKFGFWRPRHYCITPTTSKCLSGRQNSCQTLKGIVNYKGKFSRASAKIQAKQKQFWARYSKINNEVKALERLRPILETHKRPSLIINFLRCNK